MRYTEHEYKLDHLFDYIRLFASFILGAFRLLGEIGNKVVYLRVSGESNTLTFLLKKSIILNIIAIVVTGVYTIFITHYGLGNGNLLFSGTVPLVSFIVSLGILFICLVISARLKQPALHKFKKSVSTKTEDSVEDTHVDDLEYDMDIIVDDTVKPDTGDLLNLEKTVESPTISEEVDEVKTTREVGTLTDEEVKKQPPMDATDFAKMFGQANNASKPLPSNKFTMPASNLPNTLKAGEVPTDYEVEPNNAPINKPNALLSRNSTKAEIVDKASYLSTAGSVNTLKERYCKTSEELNSRVDRSRNDPNYFKPKLDKIDDDDDEEYEYAD